jgi:membrane protein implicated in regulation of membrane protease activity
VSDQPCDADCGTEAIVTRIPGRGYVFLPHAERRAMERPTAHFNEAETSAKAYASAVDGWVFWLIVAAVLGIAEALTLTFVLAMISGGALAAAITDAAGGGTIAQLIVFGVVAALLLGTVFPLARRHKHQPIRLRSGTAKLVGERAMTLSEVTTAEGGRVRIGGETWTARPYADGVKIPAGEWVDVLAIEGVTAVVHPTTLPIAS